MIDQRINDSLKELEQGLKNIDSARKQVERTINSYDGLHNSTSEYVTQLGKLTTKVKELVTAIGTDYNQKATAFDKDRKVIVDSANSAIHELSNSTETFKNSLNNVENKLKYPNKIRHNKETIWQITTNHISSPPKIFMVTTIMWNG